MCKVKCTLVQALRLCTGRTAHRGSRGITLLFHVHGTRKWWGVSVTPRPLFTPGKDPVPIVQEVGWAPGPVWTGAENLAPTRFRSPDRPARSQSKVYMRQSKNVEANQDGMCKQYVRWNRQYLSILFHYFSEEIRLHTVRRMHRKSVKLADWKVAYKY